MEVTLQDIAKELDLSPTTISRSLRHDSTINPETRARVNAVASRLGYKGRVRRPPSPVEHVSGTRTLGLLLRHKSEDAFHQDANLTKMMAGIMAVADASRVLLQVHTIHQEEQRSMTEDPSLIPLMVQEGGCQAFIVHGEQDERDIAFLAQRAPVVSMGRIYRNLPINAVVGDNMEGICSLVTQLVEMGHKRLAWIGTGYKATFMKARQAGFIQGCLEHQLEVSPHSFFGPKIYQEPYLHTDEGLFAAVDSGITAFVCGNDQLALKIIEVLAAAGRRVPEDVSVTGFDAMGLAKSRVLTSIDPHFFQIGQVAVQLALQVITQPLEHPCVINVRSHIVSGDTTAPSIK